MSYAITKPKAYPIQPKDIDAATRNFSSKLFGAFDIECMAVQLVKFCQEQKGWKAFTKQQITAFLGTEMFPNEKTSAIFSTFASCLVQTGFVVLDKVDGKYYVTHEFVTACWNASPAQPERFSS